MQNITYKLLLFGVLLFLIASCDENKIDTSQTPKSHEYMPMAVSNYWVYEVDSSINGTSQDSLYISGVTSANGHSYLDFDASVISTGLGTQLYAQNLHRKSNQDYLVYGSLSLDDLSNGLFDFEITLNDFVLLNDSAPIGTILSTQSASITQDFNGFPVTIDYTLENTVNNIADNITINSETFTDIIEAKITLSVTVVTQISIGGVMIPITVLSPQELLVMTNTYADNVGLVKSSSQITYELETLPGVTYPFPSSGSQTIVQDILRYAVIN